MAGDNFLGKSHRVRSKVHIVHCNTLNSYKRIIWDTPSHIKRQDPEDEKAKLLDAAKVEISEDKKIADKEEEEEEEEESGKMKWKDSLKIRKGKFKKSSLDLGSGEKVQQSWLADEVDNGQEFHLNFSKKVFFKSIFIGLLGNIKARVLFPVSKIDNIFASFMERIFQES